MKYITFLVLKKYPVISILMLCSYMLSAQENIEELQSNYTTEATIESGETKLFRIELKAKELVLMRLTEFSNDLEFSVYDPSSAMIEQTNTSETADFCVFYTRQAGEFLVRLKNKDQYDASMKLETRIFSSFNREILIDEFLHQFYSVNAPGACVAVLKDGMPIYSSCFGLANIEHQIKNTSETVFELASVSKQFTAYAIAQLSFQDKIELGASIRKYLPELPMCMDSIEVSDLVYHISGLKEGEGSMAMVGYEDYDYLTEERLMRWAKRQKELLNNPGEVFEYNNLGYLLLSKIIERISGQSFASWMADNVFSPIGMTSSVIRTDVDQLIPNKAYSYIRHRDQEEHQLSPVNYSYPGACCQRSSLKDVIRYLRYLENLPITNQALVDLIETKGRLNNGAYTDYAFGNFIMEYRGLRRISHLGLTGGYRTSLARFPDQGYSFIYLANNGAWETYYLAKKLYDIYLSDEFISLQEFNTEEYSKDTSSLSVSEVVVPNELLLNEYEGIYYSPEIITAYQFEVENDSLWIKSIKHRSTLLNLVSSDLFSGDQWLFHQVEFVRDEKDAIIGCYVRAEDEKERTYFKKLEAVER